MLSKWHNFSDEHYNAFGNSLQRFDFKGTLGPEGMLASDWLLPCVKFCAKPPFSLKEVGLSLFFSLKTDIFEVCCGFPHFCCDFCGGNFKIQGIPQQTWKMSIFRVKKSDEPTSFKLKGVLHKT